MPLQRRAFRLEVLIGVYALAATLAIVVPSLVLVQQHIEATLLEEEIEDLRAQEEWLVRRLSRRLEASERSVARYAARVSALPTEATREDRAEFDRIVGRDADGAMRSRRETYSADAHAGIWIPRSGALDDELACWYVRAKRVTEDIARELVDPIFVNAWVLPITRGEVIFWPESPDFIYRAAADHDYTQSDWVELARPDRDPTGAPRWTRVEYDPVSRTWMLSVIAPFQRDGEFAGTVGHDIPLDQLLEDSLRGPPRRGSVSMMVDDEGRLLASDRYHADILAREGRLSLEQLPDAALREAAIELVRDTPHDGRVRMLGTRSHVVLAARVGATDWTFISAIPRSEIARSIGPALAGMRAATMTALGIVLVASVVSIAYDRRRRRAAEAAARESEAKLVQAQKMEALGRLAGGVAHDFNNVIAVISSYATLAQRRAPDGDEPLRECLHEIERATGRASELTKQLLSFARTQPVQPRVCDLEALVRDAQGALTQLVGESVELVVLGPKERGFVRVDPGQLEQVLSNLAVNARDAMPEGGRLTIAIETEAQRVSMRVSDTGVGMSDAVKRRVFEPFFTTKEVGRGTGLGLSTSIAIVERAGGTLEVESELGRGTTFTIRLPREQEPREHGSRDDQGVPSRRD